MGLKKYIFFWVVAGMCYGILAAKTVMVEGRTATIPLMTQDLRAVHLREVGAERVYQQHFPKAIEDLNLSANQLMLLPEGLIPCGVQRLWLADNRLLSLPKEAASWTQLIYLNLDRNLFAELPGLKHTALRWLRLNGNRLKTVPELPDSVERLYLSDNQLRDCPEKPKALRHLVLANNPIEKVDATLGCGLEELDLSGTHVRALPENLDGWQTLRVLNVARCPLSEDEKDRLRAFFDPLKTLIIF